MIVQNTFKFLDDCCIVVAIFSKSRKSFSLTLNNGFQHLIGCRLAMNNLEDSGAAMSNRDWITKVINTINAHKKDETTGQKRYFKAQVYPLVAIKKD